MHKAQIQKKMISIFFLNLRFVYIQAFLCVL